MEDKKQENLNEIKYENLKPESDIKDIKSCDALDYIFENKEVKNIAVTGNYSSGKSSIINSYIKNKLNKNKQKSIVNISLATFQNKEILDKNESLQELEKEIIEQLYYSVYKEEIIKKWLISTVASLLLLIGVWNFFMIFKSYEIMNFFSEHTISKIILLYSTIFGCAIFVFSKVYESSKLSIKTSDIEFDINEKNKNQNILSENLGFIFKLFSTHNKKIKYIIFEDLDRFEKPIIFEHLKELNDMLNKCWSVKFIYVIKDDVIKDENRTKFFDFIYPVVPFVSYSSSGEVLNKLIKEKYKIKDSELSSEFIYNITAYIQDMRILKNTLNEYRIYIKDLNTDGIKNENLFSIILYKNVFTEDFVNLQSLQGNLFSLFMKKDVILNNIKNKLNDLESIIDKGDIQFLNKKMFCNLVEREIQKTNGNIDKIMLRNSKRGSRELRNNSSIEYQYLIDEETQILYDNYYYCSLEEFLKKKNTELLKIKKQLELDEQEKIESINKNIENMYIEIVEIKNASISELVKKQYISISDFEIFDSEEKYENIRRKELVIFLIREGYIDENYSRYINKFYPGSISERDNRFKGNAMIDSGNNFLDDLDNPFKIINDLDDKYLKNNNVLNINISKEIFINYSKIDSNKASNYISTFINSKDFIENLNLCRNTFTKEINIKMFKYLSNYSIFLKTILTCKDEMLLIDVIRFGNLESLTKYKDKEKLIKSIEKCSKILSCEYDDEFENIKNVFDAFGIVMKKIYINESEEGKTYNNFIEKNIFKNNNIESKLYKYCIENNMYEITEENIRKVMIYERERELENKDNNITENDLKLNSFAEIMKYKNLYQYVKENVEIYLAEVFFKYDSYIENEESLIELLNLEEIELERKIKIIENIQDKYLITDLSSIDNEKLYDYLLNEKIAVANFKNINEYFKTKIENEEENDKQDDTQILIKFLNDSILDLKENSLSSEERGKLFSFLIFKKELKNKVYEEILQRLKRIIKRMDISDLPEEKINILIDSDHIEFNEYMYDVIRKVGGKIFLKFTQKYRAEISANLIDYNFKALEISLILRDKKIHHTFKKKIIKNLENYEVYQMTKDSSNIILKYLIDKKIVLNFEISQLSNLLINATTNYKIKIINMYMQKFDKNTIYEFVEENLPKVYLDLLKDRKKPRFIFTDDMLNLINNMIKLGYRIKYDINNDTISIRGTNR